MATASPDKRPLTRAGAWATVPPPGGSRDLSRPVLVIGLAVAAALLFPLLLLPLTSEPRAASRANGYHAALVALRNDLPDSQVVLVALTEPATRSSAHAELLPLLATLNDDVNAAREVARARVPFAWPLASSKPFEVLGPVRATVADSADAGDSLVTDLVDLLNYRAVYAQMLEFDDLPLVAPSRFDRFVAELDEAGAAEAAMLAELPKLDALDAHRSSVDSAVRRLDSWIGEYTSALYIGDVNTVSRLLNELNSVRRGLDLELFAELSRIRREFDATIHALAADLERALVSLES